MMMEVKDETESPRFGCKCIFCGGFIPIRDVRHTEIPICADCAYTLGELIRKKRRLGDELCNKE